MCISGFGVDAPNLVSSGPDKYINKIITVMQQAEFNGFKPQLISTCAACFQKKKTTVKY